MEPELTAVARRGLEAATDLVARFVATADTLTSTKPPHSTQAAPIGNAPPVEALGRAWAQTVQATATWTGTISGAVPAVLDLAEASADTPDTGHAGELWVHNPTPNDIADLRVVCGPLWSADAPALDPSTIRIEPATVAVAARSSASVTISVDVPTGTPASRYRGLAQVAGRPDLWAVVDLDLT